MLRGSATGGAPGFGGGCTAREEGAGGGLVREEQGLVAHFIGRRGGA
jgi:hypothetical protein